MKPPNVFEEKCAQHPPIVSNNDIKQALKNNMLSKQMKKTRCAGLA